MRLIRNALLGKILSVVLAVVLVGGAVGGIVALSNSDIVDKKSLSDFAYSVGGLDSNGQYMNTDKSLYTKDAFECQGLEITLDFDNTIKYQIYFYDQNNDFVHTTGQLTTSYLLDDISYIAKYARIVVTPNDDDKVSKIDVLGYARQLEVKINREQGFKNYSNNLIASVTAASALSSSGVLTSVENGTSSVTGMINVSQYNYGLLVRANSASSFEFDIALYQNDVFVAIKSVSVSSAFVVTYTTSTSQKFFYFAFASLSSSAYNNVRLSYPSVSTMTFICR